MQIEEGTFAHFLGNHDRGLADRAAMEAMEQAIAAAQKHQKPAVVTVAFVLTPDLDSMDESMKVTYDVTTKLPKSKGKATLYYVDPQTGHLTRSHPDQGTQLTIQDELRAQRDKKGSDTE